MIYWHLVGLFFIEQIEFIVSWDSVGFCSECILQEQLNYSFSLLMSECTISKITTQQQSLIFMDTSKVINNNWGFFCLPQSKDESRGDGQMVKLSKLNGTRKIEDEGERREMITPALRDALTKQGEENDNLVIKVINYRVYTKQIRNKDEHAVSMVCKWQRFICWYESLTHACKTVYSFPK